MRSSEPIFNVPAVVAAIVGLLVAIQLARELFLTDHQFLVMIYALGFVPARYSEIGADLPGWPWAAVTSPVTHIFVHGDWLHLGVNATWLLAVGSPLSRRMGVVRFALFGLFCGAAGALLFLLINPGLDVPVVGASGAISGLMGGMFHLMFAADTHEGRSVLRERPDLADKLALPELLRDRRAMLSSAAFIAINLLIAIGIPGIGSTSGGIAWEAHVGGFLAGLLAFDWFDPEQETAYGGPWQS